MHTIRIAPGGLSGENAVVFFSYLQNRLSTTIRCGVFHVNSSHTYTQKTETESVVYSFEIDQTILCRPVADDTGAAQASYLVSYIDTKNCVGKGNFGEVYKINETYRCDKTLPLH